MRLRLGPARPQDLVKRLEGHGIKHRESAKGRAFEEILIGSRLKEPGRPDSLIAFIEKGLDKLLKKGGGPLRVLMALDSGLLYPLTHSERMWIKAYVNKISLEKPVIMLSQYNVERISSKELLSIFKTHPTIVERGFVFKSPMYTEPDAVIREGERELDKVRVLSGKEKKILSLITNGLSNGGIAQELSISIKTVETHRANIMKKLEIHNLVDLVKFSMRNGMA